MRTADLEKLRSAGYSIIRPFERGLKSLVQLYAGNGKWGLLAEYPTQQKRDDAIEEMLTNNNIILD